MHTVCAESAWQGEAAFATLGTVAVRPDRDIGPGDMRQADVLAIRSKTRVDAALLEGSPCRFVGTATAGFDHMDTAFMEQAGIAWSAAPGCNADSVADYITAALLELSVRYHEPLAGRTLGVIGVGQVGKRVAARGAALGLRVLLNDPPLRERTGDERYRPLPEVLAEADIVTLHVPLEAGGRWPTRHLAGRAFFDALRPGAVFLNAARGAVTDPAALKQALADGRVSHAVLDVWQDEPRFDPDLLSRIDFGTAHIAGHSADGKLNGTVQIYEQACRILDREPCWTPTPLPPLPQPVLRLDPGQEPREAVLLRAVRAVYDIREDDRALREAATGHAAADAFARLRREYRIRREFPALTLQLHDDHTPLQQSLRPLGFRLREG